MDNVKLRASAQFLWGAMIAWGLLALNFAQPDGIRFTPDRFNAVTEDTACAIPFFVLLAVIFAPFSRAKWWIVAGLTPIALSALFMGWIGGGLRGESPTLLQTVFVGNTRVRLYREHPLFEMDARDTRHLKIQQESPLLPQVVWVRLLMTNDADTAQLTLTSRHRVLCVFANRTENAEMQPNPRQVTLDVH